MNVSLFNRVTSIVGRTIIAVGFTSLWACTDAERSKYFSVGSEHTVSCYSGSKLIYKGVSSGKVLSEESSDGYYFKEKKTGKLMEVSGNCIIKVL